ncbi:MAG: aminopeptidase P family protein [Spirochaetaceae bacterium]
MMQRSRTAVKLCQKYSHEAYKPNFRCFLPTQMLFKYSGGVKNAETVNNRVKMLRLRMKEAGLAACIVPSGDPHRSEYVSAHYGSRAWISGFSGSAGTVVVTTDAAGLWTDSRYYIEAARALEGTDIDLYRMGVSGVPSLPDLLGHTLPAGSRVGVCRNVIDCAEFDRLYAALGKHDVTLEATDDLIDGLWTDRPPLKPESIVLQAEEFAGKSRRAKLAEVRRHMKESRVDVYLISSLDDIAWLMNARGTDIPFNPVFYSFVVLTPGETILYVHTHALGSEVREALQADGIAIREYGSVYADLAELTANATVRYAADKTNVALRNALADSAKSYPEPDVTTVLKARKNPREQDGIRAAMQRDGVAMVRFLMWLETAVPGGEVTEGAAAAKLRSFRAMGERFVGESFPAISGFGSHGAIVHYRAEESTQATLGEGVYLIDSGGQYLDGTTDITRTVVFGPVPEQARNDYTTVLRAHIALAQVRFPSGTSGAQLDMIARSVMWAAGVNYGHGTGHGVGCYLNVHEGPQSISPRGHGVALEEGMLSSNEPGLYREGRWGIRLENLILVSEAEQTDFGAFHRFETVTLCPFDMRLVNVSQLRPDELEWLNRYHAEVFDRLSGHLDPSERAWLVEKTRAVSA